MTVKRRFIAGAVCPRCSAMDTIMVHRYEGFDHRECVDCGFSDRASVDQPREELPTRVNQDRDEKTGAPPVPDVQVVRILDPDKK